MIIRCHIRFVFDCTKNHITFEQFARVVMNFYNKISKLALYINEWFKVALGQIICLKRVSQIAIQDALTLHHTCYNFRSCRNFMRFVEQGCYEFATEIQERSG